MTFGERVRARREEMGMSRQQLAGLLGVTLSAVSNYEKGISFPREDVILRLFDALETEQHSLADTDEGGKLQQLMQELEKGEDKE